MSVDALPKMPGVKGERGRTANREGFKHKRHLDTVMCFEEGAGEQREIALRSKCSCLGQGVI